MKTPLLLLLCLKILCCGLALGRDEAALAEFEARVKQLSTIDEASEVVTEVMAAKDYDRMEICLRYPSSASQVIRKYAEEPASEFKDRLTVDLIARPWIPPTEGEGGRERGAGSPAFFKPYADYMRERLGDDVERMGSPDDLMKPDATPEDRELVVRKFKSALLKSGVVEGKVPKRASKNWMPGKDKDAAEGEDASGGNTTLWIVGAAVLVVVAAGFFVYKRRAA